MQFCAFHLHTILLFWCMDNSFHLFSYFVLIVRPMTDIRGFTREVLIEITGNIESQEFRRRQNSEFGFAENPRAGSTDDVECFFAITHSHLGKVFTLKSFQQGWPKLVR